MTADLRSPLPRLSMRAMSWPASFYLDVRDKLDLNPPYQRGSVWDDARRRNLMRSLLMGLPIGSVVLNRRDYANTPTGYVAVVDGKQRIETLRAVADGLLPIPAVWVDERFQGRTRVVDIDGEAISCVIVDRDDHPFLRVLGDFQLPAVEAKVKTIAEEAELLELINFGGVAQTGADRKRAGEITGGGALRERELDVGSAPGALRRVFDGRSGSFEAGPTQDSHPHIPLLPLPSPRSSRRALGSRGRVGLHTSPWRRTSPATHRRRR